MSIFLELENSALQNNIAMIDEAETSRLNAKALSWYPKTGLEVKDAYANAQTHDDLTLIHQHFAAQKASPFVQPFQLERERRTIARRIQTGSTGTKHFRAQHAKIDDLSAHWKKRDSSRIAIGHRNQFGTERDVTGLKENRFWKVPQEKHAVVVKRPTAKSWTPADGKCWILTWADSLRKANAPYSPNMAVLGNENARFLYFAAADTATNMHPRIISKILAGAHLYFSNMNDTTQKVPSKTMMSDYLPKKSVPSFISFGEHTLTPHNLHTFESYFRRDKPTYNSIQKLFAGEDINLPLLRASLDRVLKRNEILPLKVNAKCTLTKENYMERSFMLTPDIFRLVNRYFHGDKSIDKNRLIMSLKKTQPMIINQMDESSEDEPTARTWEPVGETVPIPTPENINAFNANTADVIPTSVRESAKADIKNWIDLGDQIIKFCDDFHIERIAKMFAFVNAIYGCTTIRQIINTCALFATGELKNAWIVIRASIVKYSDFVLATNQGDEILPAEEKPLAAWDFIKITATDAGKAIVACITDFMNFMFVESMKEVVGFAAPRALFTDIFSFMRKSFAGTLAEMLIVLVKRFFDRLKLCITDRSFMPLFAKHKHPTVWKKEARAFRIYYTDIILWTGASFNKERFDKLRAEGEIPYDWVAGFSPEGASAKVNELVAEGEVIKELCKRDITLLRDIQVEINSLNALRAATSQSFGVGAMRVQPYTLRIVGKPRQGKSVLMDEIHKIIARSNNYPMGDYYKYQWQMNTNFQDGLGSHQWEYRLDDIDHNIAKATAGQDNHFTILCKVVNNGPLPIEQSSVEMKGKVCGRPLYVSYISNFITGKLENVCITPDVFHMRFNDNFEQIAKAIYCTDGKLDFEKAKLCTDGELWIFHRLFYSGVEGQKKMTREVDSQGSPKVYTRSEVFKIIVTNFQSHMKSQQELIAKNNGKDYCLLCYASLTNGVGCSCNAPKLHQPITIRQSLEDSYHLFIDSNPYLFAAILCAPVTISVVSTYLYGLISRDVNRVLDTTQEALSTVGDTESVWRRIAISFRRRIDESFTMAREFIRLGRRFELSLDDFDKRVNSALQYVPTPRTIMIVTGLVTLATAGVIYFTQNKNQAVDHNAVPGFVPSGWIRAPQTFEPGLPPPTSTFTKEQLIESVKKNIVRIIRYENGKPRFTTYGLAVSQNLVLTVLHVVTDNTTGELFTPANQGIISQNGIDHPITFDAFNCSRIGVDSVLIKVPIAGLTGCYDKFWFEFDNMISQFDEAMYITPEELKCSTTAWVASVDSAPAIMTKLTVPMKDGECGLPLIARMNKTWKVVGIHKKYLSSLVSDTFVAEIVNIKGLRAAASRITSVLQMLEVPLSLSCKDPGSQRYTQFPAKSEIYVAQSHYGVQVCPVGTAVNKVHGSTMKSKVCDTVFCEEYRDIEEKYCGSQNYWHAPNFRGEMKGDVWDSPYIQSLLPLMRESQQTTKMEYLWLAVASYFKDAEKLQLDGYSTISAEEAVVGIQGSVIQSVDLKTSVGMPINQPKRNFVVIAERKTYLAPQIAEQFEESKKILDERRIPIPFSLHMLKDEVTAKPPRVFNSLPFITNWLCKMETAGISAFLKANKRFFGGMVGINMTSMEANIVTQMLMRNNPDLKKIFDGDAKKLDKSTNGIFCDLHAIIFHGLARLIGHPDPDRVYGIVSAFRHAVHIIKNDMFIMGATNLSGNDKTVEFNDITTRCALAYIYYRMKYPDGLPKELYLEVLAYQRNFMVTPIPTGLVYQEATFSDDTDAPTYGDDFLLGVSPLCKFYDLSRFADLGLELGLVFTDATTKTKDMRWKTFFEIAFLKRTPQVRHITVDGEDKQFIVWCLALKTISKMLVKRVRSTLTDNDHHAEILNNVMRELAYYPRELFESLVTRIRETATKYNLDQNSHFRYFSYDEYEAMIVDNTFSTWRPIEQAVVAPQP